jgi:hypothetical protein
MKSQPTGISRGWQGFRTMNQSGYQTGRLFNSITAMVKRKSAVIKLKTTGHGAPVVQARS